jgi:hypothetical protein
MSHQLVAALWEQLRRHDLANILREIIGQHALDLSVLYLQEDPIPDPTPSMRTVFWIKTFFDLQRTYLQGNTAGHDTDPLVVPYLLPSDLVYSTIMFMIQLKTRLFPGHSATQGDFSSQRLDILQTILSGVRVILLRKETLPAEKKYTLAKALHTAWHHGRLSEGEKCLVYELLPEGIDQIPQYEMEDVPVSPFDARLPPWSSGLVNYYLNSYGIH